LAEQFTGNYTVHYHFAPQYLSRERPDGRPVAKRSFSAGARLGLKLLAGLRGLRCTPLDPFGWSPTRRDERALAGQYAKLIEQLLPNLNTANLATALQVAAPPQRVRGFGQVRRTATISMLEQAALLLRS
jgi:indolepyruvate ferredoxin oxidoreductase